MGFYEIAKAVVRVYYRLFFRMKVEGLENIPKDGALMICANHKSFYDPPLLGAFLPFRLRFMAKEELFRNPLFGKLIRSLGAFPVHRGKSDVAALRGAMKMLHQGERLIIFPEGKRVKKDHLGKGKKGAAMIAVMSGVNILPIGIDGDYRLFRKMTLRIGKVISLEEYFGQKADAETLQKITDEMLMPSIGALAEVPTYEHRNS